MNGGRRFANQLRLTADIAKLQDASRLVNSALPTISAILIFGFASEAFGLGGSELGQGSIGTFLAFHFAFGIFLQGIVSAGDTLVDVIDSFAKGRLVQPLLEAEPEVDVTKANPGKLQGSLELRDISFRYQSDGSRILNHINVAAKPGEFIAIVGASGCGKSTILRLLLGFEKPESGTILVDGKDLSMIDVTEVRRQMGVVLQSDRINAGSIYDNIVLGSCKTLDDAWQAAHDVGFAKDIDQMPMGMHSIVNEGGTNLSGGQRQRLLLARALVRDPRILLLDEATSALDKETQSIVSRSIEKRTITRVTVAHRLSTIENADRIFVLDTGQIVQCGNFQELSQVEGAFRDLLCRQVD